MIWICNKKLSDGTICGHEVITERRKPEPIKWTDGHVCSFEPISPEQWLEGLPKAKPIPRYPWSNKTTL